MSNEKICPQCGAPITEKDYKCPYCGAQIKSQSKDEAVKSTESIVNPMAIKKAPQKTKFIVSAIVIAILIFIADRVFTKSTDEKPTVPIVVNPVSTVVPTNNKESSKPLKKTVIHKAAKSQNKSSQQSNNLGDM